jgi:hypothetical protein
MHRPAIFRQRLAMETLEDRHALAGNVIAALTEGTLTILGDDQANGVNIVYDVATATHRVNGVDLGGSPTTINGELASPTAAIYSGVKHVQVWLGAGDDQLDFGSADQVYTTIAQKLAIDMGSGNDKVELGHAGGVPGAGTEVRHYLYVNKGIYVDLGAGDDLLEVANLKTNKSLIIKAGDGNDAVTFATEFTPTGATEPSLFPVNVKGNLHVHLGQGDDSLTLLHARVGDSLRIVDPAGSAIIAIADVAVNEKLNIDTGHQNDHVTLDYVMADDLNLHTNGGVDEVKIEHSRFKRMNVHTGGSFDKLKVRTSRSSQYAYLDGGDGGADFSQRGNALRGLVRRRLS